MTYTQERAAEQYGADGIQQCRLCGGWYSALSAQPCFACAVGLTDSNGHHPEGVRGR